MKSIRYKLFKKACNLDDCLDIAKTKKPSKLSVKIFIEINNTEMYSSEYMTGEYSWDFEDSKVKYKKTHGIRIFPVSNEKWVRDTDEANKRLEDHIKKLENNTGLEVIGKEKRFDY